MGIWGGLKSIVKKGVEKVKKGANYVKDKVSNVWNKFSGKSTFDEAENLYKKITDKYNKRRKKFNQDIDNLTNQIESHINRINNYKSRIKKDLFVEMAVNLEKIKDINIGDDFSIEEFKSAAVKLDSVRTKNQLYKIDFNKQKFKTSVQAVFTLGFYTRKKAKETLYAVQEEEGKINREITKMDAEITKLQNIDASLKQVVYYFESLIAVYEQLLVRLNNSVHFLYLRSMQFAHKLVFQQMSLKRLPIIQRKEIEAITTASKILKIMTDTHIMSIEEPSSVDKFEKNMKKQHDQIIKVYQAA